MKVELEPWLYDVIKDTVLDIADVYPYDESVINETVNYIVHEYLKLVFHGAESRLLYAFLERKKHGKKIEK